MKFTTAGVLVGRWGQELQAEETGALGCCAMRDMVYYPRTSDYSLAERFITSIQWLCLVTRLGTTSQSLPGRLSFCEDCP